MWDVFKDLGSYRSTQVWVRVYTYDLTTRQVPTNDMVYIPEGWFNMGDSYSEGESDELPVHSVYVSGFYIGKYEVSNERMRQVLQWAYDAGKIIVSNDYLVMNTEGQQRLLVNVSAGNSIHFEFGGFVVQAGRENAPCVRISREGALAYGNFLSEMEELESCVNFADWSCDFSRNGYRLPTEAEWEKAARGGLDSHHFPWVSYGGAWSDHLDQGKGKYYLSSEDPLAYVSAYVGYYDGNQSPPGVDMVNPFGLYDCAGNVAEWCYDWYSSTYYGVSPILDPIGPPSGDQGGFDPFPQGVVRGAHPGSQAGFDLRCASRCRTDGTESTTPYGGFRIARRDPNANITMGYRTLRSEASSIHGPITINTTGPDTPGLVMFKSSTATVDANAGSITLTVMRMGGTFGTATVDYATFDNTAFAGTDYSSATGTLHWADGDNTNRIITASISSNSSASENKTFSVLLSNATGATPGDYTNATVTIISASNRTPVYRLYSYGQPDSTYEHVWTTDWNEMAIMSTALGWLYEGVAWHAFSEYVQGTTPLYRLYSPSTRMHHYTIDATEYYILTEQSGGAWNGEGIQYFVYADDAVPGTMPVYRFYHAGMGLHHFTIDADEAAVIQATPEWGYVYEDIGFYVYSE